MSVPEKMRAVLLKGFGDRGRNQIEYDLIETDRIYFFIRQFIYW